MKLYYSPGACSLAAHIVADEADLRLQLEKVDLKSHKTENGQDYYTVNPKGYVPTIQLDDGSTLTENVAVLNYLADHTGAQTIHTGGRQHGALPAGRMARLHHNRVAQILRAVFPKRQRDWRSAVHARRS